MSENNQADEIETLRQNIIATTGEDPAEMFGGDWYNECSEFLE